MGKPLVYEGSITQGERPDWGPLLDAVDEQLTDDFMWMFEVLLANGTPLQAYKHRMTRRYVHLDPARGSVRLRASRSLPELPGG